MLKENDDVSFLDEILPEYKGKWIVLYFYPKDFTSGCTKEACNFRDKYDAIRKNGFEVIGVSVDAEESHKKFKEKYNLPFNLVSDSNRELIKRFGVENMGKARRTTFIIDPERKVRKVWGRVKVDNHAEEVINAIMEVKK
ncbi:MAG: peroxiredoxin [Thermoplasmata archaeon]|nr:peroxiredoxin [Thermoplasmata archaeon]